VNATYNDYIKFLHLLTARCTIIFSLDRYRVAIPVELRAFMSCVRALSFRQLRTRSSELKNEVSCLRKLATKELRSFLSSQFSSTLRLRNTFSSISVSFWYRNKRFLKASSSSSLHVFVESSREIIQDPEKMSELASGFYEDFFQKT
jgi:hypothetical protein